MAGAEFVVRGITGGCSLLGAGTAIAGPRLVLGTVGNDFFMYERVMTGRGVEVATSSLRGTPGWGCGFLGWQALCSAMDATRSTHPGYIPFQSITTHSISIVTPS